MPAELTQWAMDLRDHVNNFPYGTTWTMTYAGKSVLARKDYHTWTWRGGQLVTGLCIPGITLYQSTGVVMQGLGQNEGDPLAVIDPTAAVFGASAPPERTDWPLVGIGVAAIAAMTAGFLLAIRHAGRVTPRRGSR